METNTILLIILGLVGLAVSYTVSFLFDHPNLPSIFGEKIKNPLIHERRGIKMFIPMVIYWLFIFLLIWMF